MTRPIRLKTNQAHGCSNGDLDKWSKVILGRYDFFKTFLQAEKDVLELGDDKEKLQHFMAEYSDKLHQVMLNDRTQGYYTFQRTDYPWHFEKANSSVFVRN